MSQQIVIATGNAGKLKEFNQLLKGLGFSAVAQSEFAVPEADETGLTFVENAILKARNAARHTGLPAIADDSGLEVDALKGAPGIYSSRFAGADANDSDNNQKLLQELDGLSDAERSARFQCVLVFMRHADDPTPIICQGSWEGRILTQPSGENGFGYDPLFWVPEQQCSSAELTPQVKNLISHRGQAMGMLLERLEKVLV